ncbi:MAG: hypothetical protein ISS81_04730 [Candidatus Marinimicrobia bacterium]|nr:hypothetical protein [Candidatus Neomarinimicrobiota bacterium]
MSIEREIKDQYAKFFLEEDWLIFKSTAEYYLETAAKILKKDIQYESDGLKLWRRNVQKRLYIGIACELLLKACYLKNGYCTNKVKDGKKLNIKFPFKIKDVNKDYLRDDDTFSFNDLMKKLDYIIDFGNDKEIVNKGFRIAKVFRNKEGHIAVLWQDYNPQNFRDIENGIIGFYKIVFNENLKLHFSISDGEEAVFDVVKMSNHCLLLY